MRVLAVTAVPPWRPRSGYQVRCWEILRRLARRHDVALVCATRQEPADVAPAPPGIFSRVTLVRAGHTTPWSLARSLVSSRPHHVAIHATPALLLAVAAELERGPDLAYLHYLYFAPALPPRGHRLRPAACVLDQHNVDHEVWEGFAAAEQRPGVAAWLRGQARAMRRFERDHLGDFELIASVSDADALATRALLSPALSCPRVAVVANGADLEAFQPRTPERPPAPPTVLFSATDARRNVDGLSWFLQACWPAVRARVPAARLLVAGRFDPRRLRAAIRELPGVEWTGEAESLEPFLRTADVAIVPVRLGGGTKLKVFEAMAAGLPIVVVPESAHGISAGAEQGVLVRSGELAYADAVIDLLLNPDDAARLGREARRQAEKQYGWDAIVQGLESEIGELIAGPSGPAAGARKSCRAEAG